MLESEYNALLESREAELLEREMLEDLILNDSGMFTRLALLYANHRLHATPESESFLGWAVEQLRKERSDR
jgi:hypothetical protein